MPFLGVNGGGGKGGGSKWNALLRGGVNAGRNELGEKVCWIRKEYL